MYVKEKKKYREKKSFLVFDVVATATESCEKVETSCISCPPQLVKVIKLSTVSKSADNLRVVGNISESIYSNNFE